MRLGKNFTLSEFTLSQTAARHGLANEPNEIQIKNLTTLVDRCLQPLRDEVNRPMFISSGYRSWELNTLIGGSKTSAHCSGSAADFVVAGMEPYETIKIIMEMELPFDQVINEFDRWVHLGIAPAERGEVLTAYRDNGNTRYTFGLHKTEDL
jgi:hypothetical protein